MHVSGRRVARMPGVDHDHPAPRATEDERGAEARGASADHDHVVRLCLHALDRDERVGERATEVGRSTA